MAEFINEAVNGQKKSSATAELQKLNVRDIIF